MANNKCKTLVGLELKCRVEDEKVKQLLCCVVAVQWRLHILPGCGSDKEF